MIVLIAESKTMAPKEQSVSLDDFERHKPIGETMADDVMSHLAQLSPGEINSLTGYSASMSAKLRDMAYDFPNKTLGYPAIEAYTGVVFKALDYGSLNDQAKEDCGNNVRIVSSLYSWLRPSDIIKPYRLDFKLKGLDHYPITSAGELAFKAVRRKILTTSLIRDIQNTNTSEILDLLPSDASQCIDWKMVKRYADVWKVNFSELKEGEYDDPLDERNCKTPNASKLKTMRGKLLRLILTEGISCAQQLRKVVDQDFICLGTPRYPYHLQFLC